jgi:hypothetical protein
MSESGNSKKFVKPDASKPLVKRAQYLKLSDEPLLVCIDQVEEISTEEGQRVRVTCREITLKQDKDASGKEETTFEYFPHQEEQIKDSNSTSSWYLLTDYKNNKWPKEGIFYWVWKASDGIRWEEA